MITVISGGRESLKLIRALRHFLGDDEIAVIANVSDALWIDGTLASFDMDDLIFLFSGILNTGGNWHGIKGDTFSTCAFYRKYFGNDLLRIGDQERAVHIARGKYVSEGATITQATEKICMNMGIGSMIVPASDNLAELTCTVDGEEVAPAVLKQDYKGNELDIIEDINIRYFNEPDLSKEALSVIKNSDAIITGPGSPMTSIMPVVACRGLRQALLEKFTVSFVPPPPESGSEFSLRNYNRIVDVYRSFSELLIQNIEEKERIEGAMHLNTSLSSRHAAESLAWDLMSVVRSRCNYSV